MLLTNSEVEKKCNLLNNVKYLKAVTVFQCFTIYHLIILFHANNLLSTNAKPIINKLPFNTLRRVNQCMTHHKRCNNSLALNDTA